MRRIASSLAVSLLAVSFTHARAQQQMPREYRGPQIRIPGIFVTPIPNAPFTAKVEIISHELLPNGSVDIRTSTAHIARSSSGRIYNELRQLVPSSYKGDPQLISAHIYDPNNRLNIFYQPFTRIARETYLPQPPRPPANSVPSRTPPNNPDFKEEQLGTQPLSGLTLTGIRKTHIIPAATSTTGKDIVITDEYWTRPSSPSTSSSSTTIHAPESRS
jgi:hypothetical protein